MPIIIINRDTVFNGIYLTYIIFIAFTLRHESMKFILAHLTASSKFFICLIIADSNQTVKENIWLLPTVSVIFIAEILPLHYTAVSEVL